MVSPSKSLLILNFRISIFDFKYARFLDGFLVGFVHHIVTDPNASGGASSSNAPDKKYLVEEQKF